MPNPVEKFLDIAKENNADDAIIESAFAQTTLNKLETLGKNIGEKVENFIKKPPLKPNGPTPTIEQSAFVVKPTNETSLYKVTNREKEVPFIEKTSKFFKETDYKIQGFNVAATHKKNNKEYTVFAGEKVGFGIESKHGTYKHGLSGQFNVGNEKLTLEYNSETAGNSYNVSIYHQNKNTGLYAGYSNKKGLNSAFAVDENSASISCSYDKNYKNCKMNIGGYATTGDNYSNPFVGVNGRITF